MKVYLCGGINGLSDADCMDWREAAKKLLTSETIDPMRHDYRGKENENYENIVHSDLQDIKDCSVVLVNAIRPSWGTAMEVVYAFKAGKKLVAFIDYGQTISPWLNFHCTVVYSLEQACKYINGMRFVLVA